MPSPSAMLKPPEAAAVARLALRDVNRAIDERILPDDLVSREDGRRVAASACPLMAFYFDSAERLTAAERLLAIREVGARLGTDGFLPPAPPAAEIWIVRDDVLTIDLGPFAQRAAERLNLLAAAREQVVSDPEILGGTPVIRGTRVPVHDIAACVAAGIPPERILAAYPSVEPETVALAVLYTEANPVRGRPRSIESPPEGAVLLAERRVPRRRAG